MFFEEEPNSNGYASRLEVWRTNSDTVMIDVRLSDDEPMYCQCIELDVDDIRALANELNRLANEIEREATSSRKKPVSGGSQSQSPEPSSQMKLSSVIPDGKNGKKKTADVHGQYVKNGNGQMELMTAN